MNPERALTLLSLSSSWKTETPSPGHDRITPQDVAAALSGVSQEAWWLSEVLRGEPQNRLRLEQRLTQTMLHWAQKEGWKIRPMQFWRFAQTVVQELCHDLICKQCNGHGSFPNEKGGIDVCDACEGSGRKNLGARWRMNGCGVTSRDGWRKQYRERYDSLLYHALKWNSEINQALRDKLT